MKTLILLLIILFIPAFVYADEDEWSLFVEDTPDGFRCFTSEGGIIRYGDGEGIIRTLIKCEHKRAPFKFISLLDVNCEGKQIRSLYEAKFRKNVPISVDMQDNWHYPQTEVMKVLSDRLRIICLFSKR